MKLRAIQNVCIIEADETLSKIGNIIIPEKYRKTLWSGKVVSAGPRCRVVKEGDHVLIQTAQAMQDEQDGKELMFTREDDIICILPEDCTAQALNEVLTRREWEETMKAQGKR